MRSGSSEAVKRLVGGAIDDDDEDDDTLLELTTRDSTE
jgi:hypothetical protein